MMRGSKGKQMLNAMKQNGRLSLEWKKAINETVRLLFPFKGSLFQFVNQAKCQDEKKEEHW